MPKTNLRYLYEATKFGSMRATTEKLGVAVSSVSRQIEQLEDEVGLPLIEPGRRHIKLTQAGELAINYYREHLGQKHNFQDRLAEILPMENRRAG